MPPKPTPTAALANRGSWRAKTRDEEPIPSPVTDLKAPKTLTERPAEVWDALAPRLINAGILTTADVAAFTRYCRLYAAWEVAMDAVDSGGDRSAVLTLAKIDDMLRRLEASFGLTPSDRTGIRVEKTAENEGKSRFFKAG